MSRYIAIHKSDKNKQVIYGWDHALGYWVDVVDYEKGDEDFEFIIKEMSSIFGSGRGTMVETLKEYDVPGEHLLKLGLDLTF